MWVSALQRRGAGVSEGRSQGCGLSCRPVPCDPWGALSTLPPPERALCHGGGEAGAAPRSGSCEPSVADTQRSLEMVPTATLADIFPLGTIRVRKVRLSGVSKGVRRRAQRWRQHLASAPQKPA